MRLSRLEIFRILMFGAMLVIIVAFQRPCSEGVATFVDSFSPADAGPAAADPSQTPDTTSTRTMDLRRLSPEQIRHYFPTDSEQSEPGGEASAQSPAADAGAAVPAAEAPVPATEAPVPPAEAPVPATE